MSVGRVNSLTIAPSPIIGKAYRLFSQTAPDFEPQDFVDANAVVAYLLPLFGVDALGPLGLQEGLIRDKIVRGGEVFGITIGVSTAALADAPKGNLGAM
jgi:hypothetical protein